MRRANRPRARASATPRPPRCRRRTQGGQAMMEFGMVFVILLMGVMASIGTAMWSIEAMGAVTAAEQGARLAIGASQPGAQANQVDLSAVKRVIPQLQGTSFGTRVVSVNADSSGNCPTVAQVVTSYGPGTLAVCAGQRPTSFAGPVPTQTELRNWLVTVRIDGCANLLVPLPFSVGNCGTGVTIDEMAVMHPGVFQP